MPQSECFNRESVNLERPPGDLRHRQLSGQRAERNGEHHRVHLPVENAFKTNAFLGRPVNPDRISFHIQRLKKRQPLDVIPMGVRHQDVGAHPAVPASTGVQLTTQGPNSTPRIEDDQFILATLYCDT